MNPGVWKTKWFPGTLLPEEKKQDETPPLLLMELCFEPSLDDETTVEPQPSSSSISRSALPFKDDDDNSPKSQKTNLPPLDVISSGPTLPSTISDDMSITTHSSQISTLTTNTSTTSASQRSRRSTSTHFLHRSTSLLSTISTCHVCHSQTKKCYKCDTCRIRCCGNCRLRADVVLPCGSERAKECVEGSGKLSLERVLEVVAPIKEMDGEEEEEEEEDGRSRGTTLTKRTVLKDSVCSQKQESSPSIGQLTLTLYRARLFSHALPPTTLLTQNHPLLTSSNHYLRLSLSSQTYRTRTIYKHNGTLPFDNDTLCFVFKNYGGEVRLDVVDAETEKVFGTGLVGVRGLLQRRDDEMVTTNSWFCLGDEGNDCCGTENMSIELRTGVGDNLNDYYPPKKKDGGQIVGYIQCDVHFQITHNDTIIVPSPPPPSSFELELMQRHVQRILSLISSLRKIISFLNYITSWEETYVTATSLVFFVVVMVGGDAEYVGSLPVGVLILWMGERYGRRVGGEWRESWVGMERDATIEDEKTLAALSTIHRPLARLRLTIKKGQYLHTRELGLPSRQFAVISYSPLHMSSTSNDKHLIMHDKTSTGVVTVGTTNVSGVTSNPIWNKWEDNDNLKRLKRRIPSWTREWNSNETDVNNDDGWEFPILQPLQCGRHDDTDATIPSSSTVLAPWEDSLGAILVRIQSAKVFRGNSDGRSDAVDSWDDVIGEITLPLSLLLRNKSKASVKIDENGDGRGCRYTIEGWFRVHPPSYYNNNTHHPTSSDDDLNSIYGPITMTDITDDETPRVYLSFSIDIPSSSSSSSSIPKEASLVVAVTMIHHAGINTQSGDHNKGGGGGAIIGGMIGSSIDTWNRLSGILIMIQNTLGGVLDVVERLENVLLWACPKTSAIVFFLLIPTWMILRIIPTRYLILVGGLVPFIVNFISVYGSILGFSKTNDQLQSADATTPTPTPSSSPSPLLVKAINLFKTLPTNEDLRKAYFWEARRLGENERTSLSQNKRTLHLEKIWNAAWYGNVQIKLMTPTTARTMTTTTTTTWESMFAVFSNNKLLWWKSDKHFDEGDTPVGSLSFVGHCGLAGLSPLEMKIFGKEEIRCMVNVFGRRCGGGERGGEQMKLALLVKDETMKEEIENVVLKLTEQVF